MRMTILILLTLLLHLSPCVSQERHEPFREFAASFLTDSVFQRQRVLYPLLRITLNMTTMTDDTIRVNEDQWKFSDFDYFALPFTVQTYDNFGKTLRPSGQRVLSFEGIENGINLSLFFRLINGKWYLVKLVNLST